MLTDTRRLPMPSIKDFCERWKVTEFSLFGSVLREEFSPDSDVDVLVSFSDDAYWRTRFYIRLIHAYPGRRSQIVI